MNLVIFKPEELASPLPCDDRRARHILEILRCGVGDTFQGALCNGLKGMVTLEASTQAGLELSFAFGEAPEPLFPLVLIVGLCRPQTVKKVLLEATTLGVESILFTGTKLGEKSYATSKLWTNGEYLQHLLLGAEQACNPRLPHVERFYSLKACLKQLGAGQRFAFDNYTRACSPSGLNWEGGRCYLAIGSERGWAEEELCLLGEADFLFSRLGKRVLRTETACVAAVTLFLEKMGFF